MTNTFIKLTEKNGRGLWLRASTVEAIEPVEQMYEAQARVRTFTRDWYVRQSVEKILELLK